MTPSRRSELELMRAVVHDGDQAALTEVSSRLAACVNFVLNQHGWYRLASEDMRADMVDESLLRLVTRIQRGFDGVNAQFKTFVYKVVFSVTSLAIRQASRTASLDQETPRADGSMAPLRELLMLEVTPWLGKVIDPTDPIEGMARCDRAGRVAKVLACLKPDDREVLRLFEVEGLSSREVAGRLGLTEGNVWVKLHRARDRMLRLYLMTYATSPVGADEAWIACLIERLRSDEAAVLRIWWKAGESVRGIAKELGIPEGRCKELLEQGKVRLAGLAEETPRAS